MCVRRHIKSVKFPALLTRSEQMAVVGMATISSSSSSSTMLLLNKVDYSSMRRRFGVVNSPLLIPATTRLRLFTLKIRASSAAIVQTNPEPVMDETKLQMPKNILACPICYEPVIWKGVSSLSPDSLAQSTLQCSTCKKSYFGNETHIDLTITSGGKTYGEAVAASTELFRFPLISFLYERGWRQSFSIWGGFPGPEKEFELMKNYLKPALGGNIVDASCGSGMFSRLFVKSGLFSLVIALDYSETMLQQCYEYIKQEDAFRKENLILVRADIARLPFASSTIDAVHAGAALHCWPSPSAAVAEISRVLKPGGIFVATTYIVDGPLSYVPLRRTLRQNFAQLSGSHVFLSEKELEDLCLSCGLTSFTCIRNRRFVMISAMKPV